MIDESITIVHDSYEHPKGMPCRECRNNDARGIEPKIKKAA